MENMRSNLFLIKRLIPYYKSNLKTFILDLFFTITTTSCDLVFPLIFKTAMDVIDKSEPGLVFNLVKLGFCHLLIFFLELVGIFYMNYFGHAMGAKMETQMRNDLFKHYQKLPVSFYDDTKIGQLMSRLTSDLFEVGELAHHGPEDILIVLIKIILTFFILIKFNLNLTIVIYLTMSTMTTYVVFFFKKMKVATQKNKVQIGELSSKIEDSLLGIKLIKSFSNEHFEQKKFEIQNKKTFFTKLEFYKAFATFRVCNRTFSNVIYLIIIVAGAFLLVNKQISVQNIVVYTSYITGLIVAISKMLGFADLYQKGLAGINRFCEIIDLPLPKKPNLIKLNLNEIKGKIEFKNVSFSYNKKSKLVLNNLNLKIEPNQKVAIIGSTGSGKTTICGLLQNFYSVQSGEILIDNININNIDSANLHEIVGVVQQNVYLFTGTILDNLKFAKPNATFDEIEQAAKKAKIFDFICSLDQKFQTNIGERGTKLSGGQKQKISIARLFLKKPKILIFDEATSSLDSKSEKTILEAVEELCKNKTTIVIAHKLNTVKKSNLICVLNNGKIVEQGSHDELIKNKNSFYYGYWQNLIN